MYSAAQRGESFDVVVVGARLAGAATAMLLARQGVRVVLIERSAVLGDTVSTHGFMRAGVLQLHRWGLLERVREAGTPPVHHTTFTYADSTVRIDIEPADGVDALYAPRRTILDNILLEAAREAGADIRCGHRVVRLDRSRSGRVWGVSGLRPDGETFSIPARFVVGADGLQSTVARLVDAPVDYRGTHGSTVTYGYWTGGHVDGYEWIYQPNASAGAIPTNNDQVCVFADATPQRIGHGGIGVIDSIIRSAAPLVAERLRDATPPSSTRLFRAPPGYLKRAWGPGWALVGDAGYFKDPLSAHGMTDALRDAELLARALVAALAGADEARALQEYQRVRDSLSLPVLEVMDVIASHQWTNAEIGDLSKRLARAMREEVQVLASLDILDIAAAA